MRDLADVVTSAVEHHDHFISSNAACATKQSRRLMAIVTWMMIRTFIIIMHIYTSAEASPVFDTLQAIFIESESKEQDICTQKELR